MRIAAAAALAIVLALACGPAAATRPVPAEVAAMRDVGSEREVSLEVQELI